MHEVNPTSLYLLTCAIGLGHLQTVFAIVGNNQVASVMKSKFEWSNERAIALNTLISAAAIIGVIAGTLLGNCFIRQGRRRALIMFNMVALISTSLTMVLNVPLIVIGRLLFGFCCGIFTFAGQKLIEETVPVHLITKSGTSSKSFLFFGILACLLLSIALPRDDDTEAQEQTEMWRLIYGFQYICQVLTVLIFTASFPEDSIAYNIEN